MKSTKDSADKTASDGCRVSSCSLLFIFLRFGVVLLPIGLAFGVLFAWLEVPLQMIPPLGMPIGSILMLAFMDFIVTGKFSSNVRSRDDVTRKRLNHSTDISVLVSSKIHHPGILHGLKRNAMKVPELLRLRFHLLRRPNVIPVSKVGSDKASDQSGEKRETDGDPYLGSNSHDDGLNS